MKTLKTTFLFVFATLLLLGCESKSEEINLSEYQEKKVKELYSDDIELYNHQILYKKKWLN
mgnify:CR=1 FL=1